MANKPLKPTKKLRFLTAELSRCSMHWEYCVSVPYNMAFVCLECRKSFKRSFDASDGVPEELPCPECGRPSYNFGRHFKAPKKTDKHQWEKIRFLFENGFRFQKIRVGSGHHDTVPYPETLEEAKEFVVKYKQYAISKK